MSKNIISAIGAIAAVVTLSPLGKNNKTDTDPTADTSVIEVTECNNPVKGQDADGLNEKNFSLRNQR